MVTSQIEICKCYRATYHTLTYSRQTRQKSLLGRNALAYSVQKGSKCLTGINALANFMQTRLKMLPRTITLAYSVYARLRMSAKENHSILIGVHWSKDLCRAQTLWRLDVQTFDQAENVYQGQTLVYCVYARLNYLPRTNTLTYCMQTRLKMFTRHKCCSLLHAVQAENVCQGQAFQLIVCGLI